MSDQPAHALIRPARLDAARGAAEAFAQLKPRLLALPDANLGRVTADVTHAASIALGALPGLETLRPQLARLPDDGAAVTALDTLEVVAKAAFYAHVQSVADSSNNEVLLQLERGKQLQEQLLKVADTLVAFGVFDDDTVASIHAGAGDADMAADLVALGALFSSNWELVESKVPFAESLLAEATFLGTQLLHALSAAQSADANVEWSTMRLRAFRLLMNTYEELRRATSYVRWYHGDDKQYAPSLHARAKGAGGGTRSPSLENTLADRPPTSTASEHGAAAQATGTEESTTPSSDIEAGFPGADPFSE